MDIVSHGLTGGVIAWAVGARGSLPIMAAAVGGALAPDLDVLARLWDPMAPITVHRTATHSLVGGLPVALGVAGVVRAWGSREPFRSLAVIAYLGVLSHIGLDLLTPFGTAVLWPLDSTRFALGWLYVIDPVVIGIVLTGLLVAARWERHRRAVAWGSLGILTLYVLVAGAMTREAEAAFGRLLGAQAISPTRATVVPAFPGPVRWLGVAETKCMVYGSRFWAWGASGELLTALAKPTRDGLAALDGLPEVQAFLAFARFPWRTVVSDGDIRVVEYRDLAFEDHPWGGPLTLRLTLDRSGMVREIEFGHRL